MDISNIIIQKHEYGHRLNINYRIIRIEASNPTVGMGIQSAKTFTNKPLIQLPNAIQATHNHCLAWTKNKLPKSGVTGEVRHAVSDSMWKIPMLNPQNGHMHGKIWEYMIDEHIPSGYLLHSHGK